MNVVLKTPPIIEPITLSDAKLHLRLDSGSFDDNLTITQSLAYGSKVIANNFTAHAGAGVNVAGKLAIVELHCGTNGATGTNDTRIAESDDNVTFTAWTGGAFTQVTTANDNADYKKQYTGTKAYIRTESKVLLAACEFGTSILLNEAETADDDLLTALIQASREHVEDITRRALLTQAWYYYLDGFPADKDFIKIPFGNLASVASIKYKDSAGTETTMTVTTDYLVETNGEGIGRIVLPYGVSWPSATLFPSNPITIEFTCGWTSAALLPQRIKSACLLLIADMYQNRGELIIGQSVTENKTVQRLLSSCRLFDEF